MSKIKSTLWASLPFLLLFAIMCLPILVEAQCPMCRMTAESNLANGGSEGQGLNNGILYMLATPYLLIGVIGYMWWRNRRTEDELEISEAE